MYIQTMRYWCLQNFIEFQKYIKIHEFYWILKVQVLNSLSMNQSKLLYFYTGLSKYARQKRLDLTSTQTFMQYIAHESY